MWQFWLNRACFNLWSRDCSLFCAAWWFVLLENSVGLWNNIMFLFLCVVTFVLWRIFIDDLGNPRDWEPYLAVPRIGNKENLKIWTYIFQHTIYTNNGYFEVSANFGIVLENTLALAMFEQWFLSIPILSWEVRSLKTPTVTLYRQKYCSFITLLYRQVSPGSSRIIDKSRTYLPTVIVFVYLH